MLKTIGRKLMNNIGLKLLALFFAVGLWVAVVNIDNPIVRRTMTVSVTMKNQDYITSMGKYLDTLGDSNTITFSYTTTRSVWQNISASDFSATADLQKIEAKEAGNYRVPVNVVATRNASQITIETKEIYLDVSLEDLGRHQFQIKANTAGTVADGCALGTVELDSANVIQVSGPASVINRIDSVIATVNVDGMSTDVTDYAVPVFYDVNGEVIDTTKLEKSVENVKITAKILDTKDVRLTLSTMGNVAEGYQLVDVYCNPISVRVKGISATLNTLDRIIIPAEVLDLTDATMTIDKTIDISSYLPSGVSLVISSDAKVHVTAEIEKIETREFKVPIANITSVGLKSGHQLSYTERYLTVYVNAGKTALGHLNVVDLKGTINVENLESGLHLVAVDIPLDNTVYSVKDVLTEIQIISEETDTEEDSETETDTDTEKPSDENTDGAVESGSSNTDSSATSTERETERIETTEGIQTTEEIEMTERTETTEGTEVAEETATDGQ